MDILEYYVLTIVTVVCLSASLKKIYTFSSKVLDPVCFPRTVSYFFYASIISRIRSLRHAAEPLGRLGGRCSRGIPRKKQNLAVLDFLLSFLLRAHILTYVFQNTVHFFNYCFNCEGIRKTYFSIYRYSAIRNTHIHNSAELPQSVLNSYRGVHYIVIYLVNTFLSTLRSFIS